MKIDIEKINSIKEFSKNVNVLYVEDNLDARESTLIILNKIFDNIAVAEDGQEGLDYFFEDENKYNLIITDINMPRIDGIEMIKRIREKNREVPVLILSAYSDSEYFLETIKLGVEGYLLKPIDLEQFINVIDKTVEKLKLKHEIKLYQFDLETQLKDKFKELQQKNKLILNRERLALMGDMIDAIIHQFRQPLSIIKLQAQEIEYLMDGEVHCVDCGVQEALKSTFSQIEHMNETIEEFRRFFRTDVEHDILKIKDVIDGVLVLLKDELIKHTIQVKVVSDDIFVDIIANEFKHVLINLINNAKEAYTQDIKDREIVIKAYNEENFTVVEVCDNAGGIPKNVLPKIFDSNFSTKGIEKGTGIGLYITKMIVEKINGRIEAFNSKDGAIFKVYLPKYNKN